MKKLFTTYALLICLSISTQAYHVEGFVGGGVSNMNTGAEQTTFSAQIGAKWIFFNWVGIQTKLGYINLEGNSAIVTGSLGGVLNLYKGILPFDAYGGFYQNSIFGNDSFGFLEYSTINLGIGVPISGSSDVFFEYEIPVGSNSNRAPKLYTFGVKGRVGFF